MATIYLIQMNFPDLISAGVWCTSDIKTSLQVQKAKAMQTLGFLKKSLKFLLRDSFYSCTELTSDHILNAVHHLGHHIWQKTFIP